MSNIFKIYVNQKNNLNKLYLFIGNKYHDLTNKIPNIEELNKIYRKGEDFIISEFFKSYFVDDFSDIDIYNIKNYNTQIFFINNVIYLDDSIENLKIKFLKEYNNLNDENNKLSFDELYMYSIREKDFDSGEFYNKLTNNNTIDLTENEIFSYCENIYNKNELLDSLEKKDIYTFNDINAILLKKIYEINSIGQNFTNYNVKNFDINPFNSKQLNRNLNKLSDSIITNNLNLIFEYNCLDNSIYLCLFKDVIEYMRENVLDQELSIKLYFPFLYNKNILSFDKFTESRIDLQKSTDTAIDNINNNNKNNFINILNKINQNTKSLNYSNLGIKNINFNYHSNINNKISLDTIFKIFNSTSEFPLIKYNPGKKLENIYRLFCDKTQNGKKIPLLSKGNIFKYVKTFGKTNTISILFKLIDEKISELVELFYIELDIFGTINVKINFTKPISIENMNNIIEKYLKQFINNLNSYLAERKINKFTNILQDNIEILSFDYTIKIDEKKKINIKNISNCIGYLFNVISENKNYLNMRYKYVSNFNKMNDEDAFIFELIKQKHNEYEILKKIQENFKISQDEAKFKLISIISSLKVVENIFHNKKLKIKNNVGFNTEIINNDNQIIINIKNIDNIYYLDFINIYIDSIVKLLLDFDIPGNFKEEIEKICKNKSKKSKTEDEDKKYKLIEDINLKDKEDVTSINKLLDSDQDSNYEDKDKDKDKFFDLLFDDSDEESSIDSDTEKKIYDINSDQEELYDDKKLSENLEDEELDVEEYLDEDIEKEIDEEKDEEDINKSDKNKQKEELENDSEDEDDDENKKDINFKKKDKSNPILKRLVNREPKLFSSDKNKFFKEYSRLCPSNVKKQPVILTQEEKSYIDENHEGSYLESFEYGTGKEKFWYICPRFWDLENNVSLTETQVKSGDFGTLQSKDNPKGNIIEFTDKKYHIDNDKNYIDHSPGFLDEKHNKNGFCLPCCFSNKLFNKPQQIQRRSKCLKENQDLVIDKKKDFYNYIKGPDKFPLEKNKIGHLPISIQKFFGFDNNNCLNKQNNNLLKSNYACILRYGVENSDNNSFISCIADIYSTLINNNTKIVNINEMKDIIINSINIDIFLTYNNGNLFNSFLSKKIKLEDINDNDIKKYKSKIFDKILSNNDTTERDLMLKKFINSYENFIEFLRDDKYYLDYTYLWDIICKSNPLLFPDGLNLLILDITNEDITDNVKIICPKQNYSNEFIDSKKKTVILIKKDNLFEPIYMIKDSIEYIIQKTFNLNNNKFDSQLNNFYMVINKLKELINENCISNYKKNMEYKFDKNINLNQAMKILSDNKIEIIKQIIDYNNKVIAVIIISDKGKAYIPIYPSAINYELEIPIVLFDELDDDNYLNYEDTKLVLNDIYVKSDRVFNIKPQLKTFEDNMIIGIITNSNQFVRLNKPEIKIDDELESITDNKLLYIDKKVQTSFEKDNKRIETINNIRLETNFYNAFKNTFKKILSKLINREDKRELLNILNDTSILYLDKLNLVLNLLKKIGENDIIFSKYDIDILYKIKNITTCLDENNCDSDYCMKTDDNCKIIIPELNLINNTDNKNTYYNRLADEFIRYNKFKQFIFESDSGYIYGSIKFKLNNSELLIYQSSLTQEYFKDIKDRKTNNLYYSNNYENIDYDTKKLIKLNKEDFKIIKKSTKIKINKEISKKLKEIQKSKKDDDVTQDLSEEELEQESEEESEEESKQDESSKEFDDIELSGEKSILNYIDTTKECKYSKNRIRENFKNNFKKELFELYFELDNKHCSYQILLIIIKHYHRDSGTYNNLNIKNLQDKLLEIYLNHPYRENLFLILFNNNKKNIMKKIFDKENAINFSDLIYTDDYYISYIDIYLLSIEYKLPIILICNTNIDLAINKKDDYFLICNKNEINNNYYFIKIASSYTRNNIHNKLLFFKESLLIDVENDIVDKPNKLFKNNKLYTSLKNELSKPEIILTNYIINYKNKKNIKMKEAFININKKVKPENDIKLDKKTEDKEKEDKKTKNKQDKLPRCPNGTRRNKVTGLCE